MGRISHQDVYSGQLFWHGHGCALLNPEPNQIGTGSQQHWQDVYAEGIRVGDVGLISDSGDFLSLFNIFKSIDDPVNQIYGVPPDFEPLEFRENLLSSSPGLYHSSNARILSKDTKEVKLGADGGALAPGMPFAPGLGFEFQFSRTQGAVLVLPEGARRVDYLGLPDIRTYTENNAESWYRFINEQVRMDARNGSLYVITGYDRTYCYENVAFQSSSKTSSIYFKAGDLGRLALSYSSLPEHEQRRKASSPGHTLHNLSPFIRGFKVMINQRFRHKPAIKVLALQGSDVKPDALLYRGSVPNFSSRSASSLNSSGSSSSGFRPPAPPSTPSSSGSTRSSQRSDSQISSPGNTLDLSPITSYSPLAGDSESASDSLSPRGSSIFDSDSESEPRAPVFQLCHPSDIINEYILEKISDTLVAVTHDDEWASVLEETDTEFPDKFTLISRMLKKFPSRFEPVKPEDDPMLGASLSSTSRRTSPETCMGDERPAEIFSHIDAPVESGEATMPIVSLKHVNPDSNDGGEYIGTKRRKLNPDNSLATHDTQSPRRTTFTFNVKLEDFDSVKLEKKNDNYDDDDEEWNENREADSSQPNAKRQSVSSSYARVGHVNGQPYSPSAAAELAKASSSMYSHANGTASGKDSQSPRRTTFTFVKLEDLDDNPLITVDGDIHYSPDQKPLNPYGEEALFSSPPFSTFSSWDNNSVGTATPSLVSFSSGAGSSDSSPFSPYSNSIETTTPSLISFSSGAESSESLPSFSPLYSSIETATPSLFSFSSGAENSEKSVSSTSTWGDFVGELGGHSGYTPFGVPISMLMPGSRHTRSSLDTIPMSSGRCIDESGPSLLPMVGRDILKERVASPALAAVASSRRRSSSAKNLYACHMCSSTFTAKHNLKNHMNSHLGIREHGCDKCGSRFGTKHVLKRHQKTCNGIPRSRQAEATSSTSGNKCPTPSIPTEDFVFVSRRSQTPSSVAP